MTNEEMYEALLPDKLVAACARELLHHLKSGACISAIKGSEAGFAFSPNGQVSLTGLAISYP